MGNEGDGSDNSDIEFQARQLLLEEAQRLPELQCRCVTLVLKDGLSPREIAEAMGITLDTVTESCKQAKAHLESRLKVELPT